MLRLRRYRVFVACAVVFLFLLYRVSVNSAWDDDLQSQYRHVASAVLPNAGQNAEQELKQKPVRLPTDVDESKQIKIPDLKPSPDAGDSFALPNPAPVADVHDAPAPTPPPPPSAVIVPERKPGVINDAYPKDAEDALHIQKPPGRVEPSTTFEPPIHWTQLPERFPVPEGSLIPLPTGKTRSIPRIQHKFESETVEAKREREERLAEVKIEMKRAWNSYSRYAFGHDELIPIAQSFRDPFGGWGATLVDSLDTLWIMGMKDEFDEAYRGLNDIDFTTCTRNDIPVFETTIRYLGGLIAAYDVSGGHKGDYPLLLKKAVELAEILMGVFDTPNRMPLLYYNWKPAFASQPHRASTRSGVAEFGTLSMEFTRLAQLTGKDKYYDAIARITDALDEWQNREDDTAPLIAGIFPQDIDASGCNSTATNMLLEDSSSPRAKAQVNDVTPGRPLGHVAKNPSQVELRDASAPPEIGEPMKARERSIQARTPPQPDREHWSARFQGGSSTRQPLTADGLPAHWECVAQNLTAATGTQMYGMGGSQDSAYEYFPKQYLLLGGLDTKYKSLHENTVEAVKKHLLFRPLAKDEPDVLFSAKLKVSPNKDVQPSQKIQTEYEVTHLTCFLGGMFAMGGKIFDSQEDLEIGRRLTDGCVWAYSSMPTGIMAEYAQLAPCQSTESCAWNETEWYERIDPDGAFRELQIEKYYERLAQWEVNKQKAFRAEAERLQAEEELGYDPLSPDGPAGAVGTVPGQGKPHSSGGSSHSRDGAPRRDDDSQYQPGQTKRKRAIDPETGDTLAFDPSTLDQKAIEEKVKMLQAEYENPTPPPTDSFGGEVGQVPIDQTKAKKPTITPRPSFTVPSKPQKPPTHLEYVTERIKGDGLPSGYTKIGNGGYQLRPEAIESVWYMYRITGDRTWQDKGWKMWKSIISNVKTDAAHSAVNGVNSPYGVTFTDHMESFWTAETLKYFYLLYSEPDVVSLDDWVLNTEAHPFRRPS
ncbi:hypothetical protein N0V93_008300 [Gnomoniopsis smithogilvyi]|uniref:alpha-1,2-Mannosidase n=1 Tax=Gnomoniopsis smithogilvyi TaxID=1191159 RepID=A0A9W8YMF7_9PEZI|nr:hypothetical protein N0V93_008300 [Gnomoniopsis smithogilvyi]